MGSPDASSVMLMPIGRFARASRLSVKSLRNYDESGLLRAAFVDPQSGYRYYRAEQLARADAIRSLRIVDMPLPQIAAMLDADDPEPVLMSHLAALELQRDELNQMAQQLRRRIELKEYIMSSEVTFKTNPSVVVAAYRTSTTHTSIFTDIPEGFGKVLAFLAESDRGPVGVPFTLYYQAPDADTAGDIAMCVPVAAGTVGGSGVDVLTLQGGAIASTVHEGSYDNMGESYATVSTQILERGHQILGPHREVYLNSPAEVSEDELLTEIQFPVDNEDLG